MAWPPTTHQDVQDEITTLRGRIQAGAVTSGTLVASTATTVPVTFSPEFSVAPTVVATQLGGAGAIVAERRVTVNNVSTTGFDMVFYRATGTAAIDASWIAVKP